MIEVDVNLERLNTGSESSHCMALTRHERLSHAMILMKNESRVHLIVSSNNPLYDSGVYTVVLQQKFENNYWSLIKKVTLATYLIIQMFAPAYIKMNNMCHRLEQIRTELILNSIIFTDFKTR